jgi:RNA polymerase sigma-70 factor (ECF subfamily)
VDNPADLAPGATAQPLAPEADLRRGLACLLSELRAYARFLVRDPAKSDDLVQDTIVRALAASVQFTPGTSLKAWLFTILRHTFYEQSRRRVREKNAMAAHASGQAEQLQPHHSDITDMSRLLWTLPPLLREALILVGAQEFTHEEAASICGVPAGTMRARVTRARAQLAKAFGDGARPWEA